MLTFLRDAPTGVPRGECELHRAWCATPAATMMLCCLAEDVVVSANGRVPLEMAEAHNRKRVLLNGRAIGANDMSLEDP